MSIKEGNKRITITIDPETEDNIEWLKIFYGTKQTSKVIEYCTRIVIREINKAIKDQNK